MPYDSAVTTSANKTLLYWSRERPKIYWDTDTGRMTHLITAVAPEPREDEPATLRYSSCSRGTACSTCKGQVFTATLIQEFDLGPAPSPTPPTPPGPPPPSPPPPPSECHGEMLAECGAARAQSPDKCEVCCGEHDGELQKAGCAERDFETFCHAVVLLG